MYFAKHSRTDQRSQDRSPRHELMESAEEDEASSFELFYFRRRQDKFYAAAIAANQNILRDANWR